MSVKVKTDGYGGRKVSKHITVQTNDKENSQVKLTITGNVERFAVVSPKMIRLMGEEGKGLTAQVHITPDAKYPFRIESITTQQNTKNFTYKLEEVNKNNQKQYVITVTNLKKEVTRYFDKLIIKTDNKNLPELKINLYCNIQAKISKVPPKQDKKTEVTPQKGEKKQVNAANSLLEVLKAHRAKNKANENKSGVQSTSE